MVDQPRRPGQGEWELRQGDVLLGVFTLNEEESDFPWYGCDFVPTAAIEPYRDLYARELAAVDGEDDDAMHAALDEVEQQGIVLVYREDGEVIREYLLHLDIDGRKGWFRY